jgi:hypothetical protein
MNGALLKLFVCLNWSIGCVPTPHDTTVQLASGARAPRGGGGGGAWARGGRLRARSIKFHKHISTLRSVLIEPRNEIPKIKVFYGGTGYGKSHASREIFSKKGLFDSKLPKTLTVVHTLPISCPHQVYTQTYDVTVVGAPPRLWSPAVLFTVSMKHFGDRRL